MSDSSEDDLVVLRETVALYGIGTAAPASEVMDSCGRVSRRPSPATRDAFARLFEASAALTELDAASAVADDADEWDDAAAGDRDERLATHAVAGEPRRGRLAAGTGTYAAQPNDGASTDNAGGRTDETSEAVLEAAPDPRDVREVPAVSRKTVPRIRSKRNRPRAKTIALKRLTREELRRGALANPPVEGVERPVRREDCRDAPRPCPWVACKHHLYLDINPNTGSIKLNFPDLEPWELQHTCALDVAEQGALTLEEIGLITNLTRERVRQVEVRGLLALRARSRSLR